MKPLMHLTCAQRIARAVDYITIHLDESLDIHRLSEEACLSPFHFHRVFLAVQGETVADMVRRLRLDRAASRLMLTEVPVATLANEAGYATVQAFTRAFRSTMGVPPAEFRRWGAGSVGVGKALKTQPGARTVPQVSEVTVANFVPVRVAALSHSGDLLGAAPLFHRLRTWLSMHGLLLPRARLFAMYLEDPTGRPRSMLTGEVSIEIPLDAPPVSDEVDGVFFREIAPGQVVSCWYTGPYAGISSAYHWMITKGLQHQPHELADAPCFEELLNDPWTTPSAALKTALHIPLRMDKPDSPNMPDTVA